MILVLNKGVKRLQYETGGNRDPHVGKRSFCFLYPFFLLYPIWWQFPVKEEKVALWSIDGLKARQNKFSVASGATWLHLIDAAIFQLICFYENNDIPGHKASDLISPEPLHHVVHLFFISMESWRSNAFIFTLLLYLSVQRNEVQSWVYFIT